jgi:hypothetical protein
MRAGIWIGGALIVAGIATTGIGYLELPMALAAVAAAAVAMVAAVGMVVDRRPA